MRKDKIASTLFVPIKDDHYLLDNRGAVRVYKTLESLKKFVNEDDFDSVMLYDLKGFQN